MSVAIPFAPSRAPRANREPGTEPTLWQLAGYFLRLGATGFGGPVALAHAMRRDLVERRRWLSETEYEDGLAIAAACPGPLAYQLGVYCGFLRHRVAGGILVAVAFALAPFLLVTAVAALYADLRDTWQLRAVFYGVSPIVVALILKASFSLGKKTLRRNALAWTFAIVACLVTLIVQRELTLMFLAAGALGAVFFQASAAPATRRPAAVPPPASDALLPAGAPAIFWLGGGMAGKLFLFFFKTGLLVFGSGLVIVPFLKSYVVDQYHWLGNREFLDAVAVGLVSPGPVVITATFVGYLLAGVSGAFAATAGIFLPAVILTLVATPILLRLRTHRRLQGFIRGVTAAVIGVLVGTTGLVARTAIGDQLTVAVALSSAVVLFRWQRFPEPLLVLAGAGIGLLAYPWLQPRWLP